MAERPPRRRDDDDKKPKTGRAKPRPATGRKPRASTGRKPPRSRTDDPKTRRGGTSRSGGGGGRQARDRTDRRPAAGDRRPDGRGERGRGERGRGERGRRGDGGRAQGRGRDDRARRDDGRGRSDGRKRPDARKRPDGRKRPDDQRRERRPAQKRSARSSRDEQSPTRSGIQYPPRKTVRRGAPAEPSEVPPKRRPVLRTVKGSPAPAKRGPAKRSRTTVNAATRAAPRRRRRSTEAADELARVAGRDATAAQNQLARAAEAFAAGRERDAARLLRPLRDAYPDVAAVRELFGLVHYRLGQYPAAAKELTAFADLTGSVEQHPVLMDCWRAQRRYDRVEALWEDLAHSSPSGALVTEGRIVLAGARADSGDLQDAIATLARRADDVKRVQPHHLRLWYALADLYERAGELPVARDLFLRVRKQDASFADVAERLAALA